MAVIQISSGIRVRTYDPAPADFDPRIAPDNLLLRHGFPTRPDAQASPELRKAWERAVTGKLNYIVPTFRVNTEVKHGPARTETAGTATSNNWSGSVVLVPDSGHSFKWIEGRWTVPNPYPSSTGSWDYAAEWVGIDGWGSGDVLQAGTETDVLFSGASTVRRSYAWWEWFHPGDSGEVQITNLPVSPGDVMWCMVCVVSPTSGTFFLRNVSSGDSTSFTVDAAPGVSLIGNSAEWVVERPTVNNSLPSLPDYGAIFFDEGQAFYATGAPGSTQNETEIDLGSGTFVTMTGNNNASLSVPTDESATAMEVSWEAAS